MNFDNPQTRATIYRSLCLLIIVAGCDGGAPAPKPLAPEEEYLVQMKGLSANFVETEKRSQQAIDEAAYTRDATRLLEYLKHTFELKSSYIRSLQVLRPTPKYQEFHKVFIEWRQKEHENEGLLLKGYGDFMKDRSKKNEAAVEKLTKQNDAIGAEYEAKIKAIVKKQGFDSVEKFMALGPPAK